nr:immunoglobulin heavy chain junction region [Macaca mulatta]MOY22171.1 immunoglobulin heavy chain junction region [Macaca mulatta]MOY22273.1 immunoglobulin heavy chain junction region [Macaca mulatta]MOY23168.1 immunoglobulin heavy chain junction region [Macaca mulatta]MOY24593.1 immunoglobulin heavy chain junction region [Macaca mulatta]
CTRVALYCFAGGCYTNRFDVW